jgi:hypothetical protein
MYGKTTSDQVTFVAWNDAVAKTKHWMQNKMVNQPNHRTIGYSFQG